MSCIKKQIIRFEVNALEVLDGGAKLCMEIIAFSKNSDEKCTGNFTLNNCVPLKILLLEIVSSTEASEVRKEAYLDFVKT